MEIFMSELGIWLKSTTELKLLSLNGDKVMIFIQHSVFFLVEAVSPFIFNK